jgi:hypothetical protein
MAHQPSTTIPKEWAPQSWKIEESMQTKMLNGRMKNARRELLTLERQLGMIHEMSLDDLKQFVGKRLFDPTAKLKVPLPATTKKGARRRKKKRPGQRGGLPGVKNARVKHPSSSAIMMNDLRSEWDRRLQEERRREGAEREAMHRADGESRALLAVVRRERRGRDEQLFVYYAGKFGPLSGLTYVSTDMPGELYEKIISEAARIVQKWWRDIGPQRMLRKKEAATFMQSLYRGRRGRETYLNEAKVKGSLKKLMNRVGHQAWLTWTHAVRRKKGTRRLLRNRLLGAKSQVFEAWSGWAAGIAAARNETLQPALTVLKHRRSAAAFRSWRAVHQQNLEVKRMMRRSFGSTKQYAFETWSENVVLAIEHRAATRALRDRAATEVQRVYRGHYDRTVRLDVAKHRHNNRRTEERRDLKRRKERHAYLVTAQEEAERLAREKAHVTAAVDHEMAQFDTMVRKNKEWRARKGEQLKEERAKWMQDAHYEAIREYREDDPPARECQACLCAFHNDHLADGHLCEPPAGGTKEVSAYFLPYHAKPAAEREKDGFFTKLFGRRRTEPPSEPSPSPAENGAADDDGLAPDDDVLAAGSVAYPKRLERLESTVRLQRDEIASAAATHEQRVKRLEDKVARLHTEKREEHERLVALQGVYQRMQERMLQLEAENKRLGGAPTAAAVGDSAGDEVADLSAELLAEIAESAPSAVGRRSGKLRLPVGAGCIGKYKKSIRAAPHVVTVLKGNGREGKVTFKIVDEMNKAFTTVPFAQEELYKTLPARVRRGIKKGEYTIDQTGTALADLAQLESEAVDRRHKVAIVSPLPKRKPRSKEKLSSGAQKLARGQSPAEMKANRAMLKERGLQRAEMGRTAARADEGYESTSEVSHEALSEEEGGNGVGEDGPRSISAATVRPRSSSSREKRELNQALLPADFKGEALKHKLLPADGAIVGSGETLKQKLLPADGAVDSGEGGTPGRQAEKDFGGERLA